MKKIFIDFINNLSKITSLFVMLMVLTAHIVWIKHCFVKSDFSLLSEVLIIDYGFVAALLGITTYSQNIQAKANKNESPKTE